MSLHHTKLFHASFNNNRDERRIGFGISYIPTEVRDIGKTKAHALLVRGEDRHRNFLSEMRMKEEGQKAKKPIIPLSCDSFEKGKMMELNIQNSGWNSLKYRLILLVYFLL